MVERQRMKDPQVNTGTRIGADAPVVDESGSSESAPETEQATRPDHPRPATNVRSSTESGARARSRQEISANEVRLRDILERSPIGVAVSTRSSAPWVQVGPVGLVVGARKSTGLVGPSRKDPEGPNTEHHHIVYWVNDFACLAWVTNNR